MAISMSGTTTKGRKGANDSVLWILVFSALVKIAVLLAAIENLAALIQRVFDQRVGPGHRGLLCDWLLFRNITVVSFVDSHQSGCEFRGHGRQDNNTLCPDTHLARKLSTSK